MNRTKSNRKNIIIVAAALFIIALILTEFSPFSSRAVALCNGGYGTFDMKVYNSGIYLSVMHSTTDFGVYWKYYLCDFFFIAAFMNFMIQLTRGFHLQKYKWIPVVAYAFAILRGTLDALENAILLNAIYRFPDFPLKYVDLCNVITRVKFLFMGGWVICFIVLVILTLREKGRCAKI